MTSLIGHRPMHLKPKPRRFWRTRTAQPSSVAPTSPAGASTSTALSSVPPVASSVPSARLWIAEIDRDLEQFADPRPRLSIVSDPWHAGGAR